MDTAKQRDFLIKLAFYAAVTSLVYIVLKLLSGPLFPFAFAVFITVLLQKFVKLISKKFNIKRQAAAVITVLTLYIAAGCIISWICYMLYRQLIRFVSVLPQYTEQISKAVQGISSKIESIIGLLPDSAESLVGNLPSATAESFASAIADALAKFAGSVASGVPYFLLSVVVMIVASAYFAKDYDDICKYIVEKAPKKVITGLSFMKENLIHNLSGMLKGYIKIMLITFIELFIGLTVIGSEYALIISLVTAVVDILPVFGSGTVLIPWALFSALFGNVKKAVGILVVYLVITAVRNVIEPKIIGSKLGVHPLIMLTSVFLGIKLFGAAGIFFLPLAVIVAKNWFEYITV